MSDRYYRWLEMMDQRDAILVPLAIIAIALVLAWILIDYITPPAWQRPVKLLYMFGGVVLYILAVIGGAA